MTLSTLPSRIILLLIVFLCGRATFAQASSGEVTALMVSDLHFNPFHDPAKVNELAAAPAKQWEAILSRGETSTQQQDFEALRTSCKLRGIDTPHTLFASAAMAMREHAADARVITITGDMLAHSFKCMFQKTQPNASAQQYTDFTAKTMEYEMLQLRRAAPRAALHFALGNNDSDCGDYRHALDEPWFGLLAEIGRANLAKDWTSEAQASFAHSGSYGAALSPAIRGVQLISLNDIYLSAGYKTCDGVSDPEAGKREIQWLQAQLADARTHHERVWIMGHLPIGVSPYATFLQQQKTPNLCTTVGKPNTYLPTTALDETLANNADIIKLALFGHTHVDEMKLVAGRNGATFPLKITAALTAIGGNLPSFTVARINTVTGQVMDYTVFSAPNKEGTIFTKEYTFSEAYGHKGFTPESVHAIIADLRQDTTLSATISQDYVKYWSVGAMRNQIQPAWPGYVCGMDKINPDDYKQCVCKGPLGTSLAQ